MNWFKNKKIRYRYGEKNKGMGVFSEQEYVDHKFNIIFDRLNAIEAKIGCDNLYKRKVKK